MTKTIEAPPRLTRRLVFDGLTRTAFDACAELCNEVQDRRMDNLPETERPVVRCALRTDGPGSYLLSFEIPHDEPAALAPERKPKCWSKGRRRSHQPAGSPDPALQLELLSATRIVEEMILAVSLICATPSGQLGAVLRHRSHGLFVEFINGVKAKGRYPPRLLEHAGGSRDPGHAVPHPRSVPGPGASHDDCPGDPAGGEPGIQLGHHRQWIPAGLRERGGAGDP